LRKRHTVADPAANEAKFRRVFDDHFDAITRYCFRRLPANQANDAAASVFTVAWKKIDQMPDEDRALLWLYGIARNEVSTFRRSLRRAAALRTKLSQQPRYPEASPESLVVRSAEQASMLRALHSLKQADREVLRMRAYEGLNLNEVSIALGCSPEAAKKRSARAMKRLVKAAGPYEWTETPHSSRAIPEGGDA
jgi:RNA polymerase sigma-70 factor (ECF subfamily)